VLFLADWVAVLPQEAMILFGWVFLAPPVYFFGVAFLTDWIENGVYDPAGVSRPRVARSAAASLLVMLLFVAGVVWSAMPAGSYHLHLGALSFSGMLTGMGVILAWSLAHWNAPRRRYHEDWGYLPIEIPS
jgi:hypothetical protein